MRILDTRTQPNNRRLENVNLGECFIYEHVLCMKVTVLNGNPEAIYCAVLDLTTNQVIQINVKQEVDVVNTFLTIQKTP